MDRGELDRLVRRAATQVVLCADLKRALEHGFELKAEDIVSRLRDLSDPLLSQAVGDFLWGLLRDGWALPEHSGHRITSSLAFRSVKLTPDGAAVLTGEHPTAHDGSGLLKAYDEMIGRDLDESIRSAFESALFNFQSPRTLVGCAILLGVASENLIDELIKATRLSEANQKFLQRKAGHQKATAADRAAVIQEIWAGGLRDLPDDCQRVVTQYLAVVANLLRELRNKGGHPNKLGLPTRPELFFNLNMFPMYCRELKRLIDWMNADPDRVL